MLMFVYSGKIFNNNNNKEVPSVFDIDRNVYFSLVKIVIVLFSDESS